MGSVRDLQRERLKHLLANAILEMWKKETGSLSSVMIEGTICITSGTGRTTVLQVTNKFQGSIPEAEEEQLKKTFFSAETMPRTLNGSITPSLYTNQAAMAAFMDNLSPASLVSPATEHSRSSSQESTSPAVNYKTPKTQKYSGSYEKEDNAFEDDCNVNDKCSDDDEDVDVVDDDDELTEDINNNNSSLDLSSKLKNTQGDSKHGNVCNDKTPLSSKSFPINFKRRQLEYTAVDLSKRDNDLALSPPQSYTAQVRDVIRNRLLASKVDIENNVMNEVSRKNGEFHEPDRDRTPSKGHSAFESYRRHHPYLKSDLIAASLPSMSSAESSINSSIYSYLSRPGLKMDAPLLLPPPGLVPPVSPQNLSISRPLFPMQSTSQPVFPVSNQLSPPPPSTNSSDSRPSSPSGDKDSVNGEQRVYKCDFCQKTFLFKSKYQEHLPVHTNLRPFQCHLCSRTYKYKYDLRVHLRTHMGIPTKSTTCPFCTVKFETNKLLRQHIKDAHQDQHKVSEEECTQPNDNLPPAL